MEIQIISETRVPYPLQFDINRIALKNSRRARRSFTEQHPSRVQGNARSASGGKRHGEAAKILLGCVGYSKSGSWPCWSSVTCVLHPDRAFPEPRLVLFLRYFVPLKTSLPTQSFPADAFAAFPVFLTFLTVFPTFCLFLWPTLFFFYLLSSRRLIRVTSLTTRLV